MAQVTLRKVVKKYDEVLAVRGIDLDISDKEFIVLVGPSGCGKSTTLRMIAGLEEISGGDIAIGGDVVNDVPPKDRDIAMVFQNYALYPHMNVYENMSFGLKLKKTPKDEIDKRVKQAAQILDITELLDRKPKPTRQMPATSGQLGAGGVIGFLSGLVGAGGGFVSVPFMAWCNVPLANAVATSAALGFPIALANTAGYIISGMQVSELPPGSLGYVFVPALAIIASASVISAPLGVRATHTWPVKRIRRIFAMALYLLAAYMLWKTFQG